DVRGGVCRGRPEVAAYPHEGSLRPHDRAAPDRPLSLRHRAAPRRRRRKDGVTAPDARVLEAAARLARDELAPRAAEYDREAKNPVDSWRALGRAGFLGAAIPRAHGGLGLDMPTYAGVIRTLAGACAS